MNKLFQTIKVFLGLKASEIKSGIVDIKNEYKFESLWILGLFSMVVLLASSRESPNLLLQFVTWFLVITLFSCIALALLFIIGAMIYIFGKWIYDNWQKAKQIVEGKE